MEDAVLDGANAEAVLTVANNAKMDNFIVERNKSSLCGASVGNSVCCEGSQ